MTSIQQILSRLASANHRRKRAEKKLKKTQVQSKASIEHWKNAAEAWQKMAYEYAKKYQATLNLDKSEDRKEGLRIYARFFAYEMQRAFFLGKAPSTTIQTINDGFYPQAKEQEMQELSKWQEQQKLRKLMQANTSGCSVFINRNGKEIECKVNGLSISSGTRESDRPSYYIDLVDCNEPRNHYPVTNASELMSVTVLIIHNS